MSKLQTVQLESGYILFRVKLKFTVMEAFYSHDSSLSKARQKPQATTPVAICTASFSLPKSFIWYAKQSEIVTVKERDSLDSHERA
jgi:hypothetical protein